MLSPSEEVIQSKTGAASAIRRSSGVLSPPSTPARPSTASAGNTPGTKGSVRCCCSSSRRRDLSAAFSARRAASSSASTAPPARKGVAPHSLSAAIVGGSECSGRTALMQHVPKIAQQNGPRQNPQCPRGIAKRKVLPNPSVDEISSRPASAVITVLTTSNPTPRPLNSVTLSAVENPGRNSSAWIP